jgi:hypothetical protein
MSTKGSIFPCVASSQFQSQICCSHVNQLGVNQGRPQVQRGVWFRANEASGRGEIWIIRDTNHHFCVLPSQIRIDSGRVVERRHTALLAHSFCGGATGQPTSKATIMCTSLSQCVVPVAPPAAGVAGWRSVASAAGLAPVVCRRCRRPDRQEATPNTRTSDPTLFFNMLSLTGKRLADHGVRRKRLFLEVFLKSRT